MKPSFLIPALAGAMVLSACAQSGPGPRGVRPPAPGEMPREVMTPAGECLLKPLAARDSGRLTRRQMDDAIRDSFGRADLNGDGALDAAEVRALNASRASTCDSTPLIDWSGTGRIGLTAYGARYRTVFAKVDLNGDGTISREEMDHVPRPIRDMRKGPPGAPPGSSGQGGAQVAGFTR